MLLPEQPRMPMHILSWTPKFGFTMWTLKKVDEELNVDDRSSGAVDFLYAVAQLSFPTDLMRRIQKIYRSIWVGRLKTIRKTRALGQISDAALFQRQYSPLERYQRTHQR